MIGRRLASPLAVLLAVAGVSACSTGVPEADRAIFLNACAATTGATQADCACAYDDLNGQGGASDRLVQETIDDLRRGRVPQRLTRAIARCTTPR